MLCFPHFDMVNYDSDWVKKGVDEFFLNYCELDLDRDWYYQEYYPDQPSTKYYSNKHVDLVIYYIGSFHSFAFDYRFKSDFVQVMAKFLFEDEYVWYHP
jgi:hypothetical protein